MIIVAVVTSRFDTVGTASFDVKAVKGEDIPEDDINIFCGLPTGDITNPIAIEKAIRRSNVSNLLLLLSIRPRQLVYP